ncbi:MAG: hypothetical protein FD131_4634 [Rhodocyclaceae bacterium]|nr:MAG: hypothetical protein FD131_4634 [Rhodocyclaceae bacterium]
MTPASISELCQRFRIAIYQVGEVYETDQDGRPIPDGEKDKWFVSAPADMFPHGEIEAIPLSNTEAEAEALAVSRLGLRELQEAIDR